ncbi:serine hydroxymethyltransferase, partial [bacterium]|nr:serine hydroxymethyltransferase [bacterium]
AVAFGEALASSFKEYAAQILKNAKAMEEVFRAADIRMLGGGTSNHLILADVYGSLGITGQEAQTVLDEVGVTVNKNMIANETRKALDPSGIRFGTPALTTRGMKEGEATRIAEIMVAVLRDTGNEGNKRLLHEEIVALAEAFPVPETFV